MQTSDSIVIIPTYNERENIENIIRAVFALKHGFHILVIEEAFGKLLLQGLYNGSRSVRRTVFNDKDVKMLPDKKEMYYICSQL